MELTNVYVSFNEKNVLRSINFSWKPGEAIMIIGANGAGKTTLLKVVSLLLKPNAGTLNLKGVTNNEWKRKLGMVLPESFLYNDFTAYENLVFYQNLYGNSDHQKINKLLKQVELYSVKDEFVGAFSKGMKQRLSIARAFIHDPTHLILDEPFDGLDLKSKQIIENLLVQKKENGIGWMLVSHDVKHAWKLCDQAILMDKGSIRVKEQCSVHSYSNFMSQYKELLKGSEHELF